MYIIILKTLCLQWIHLTLVADISLSSSMFVEQWVELRSSRQMGQSLFRCCESAKHFSQNL